jgi:hypothetical protein
MRRPSEAQPHPQVAPGRVAGPGGAAVTDGGRGDGRAGRADVLAPLRWQAARPPFRPATPSRLRAQERRRGPTTHGGRLPDPSQGSPGEQERQPDTRVAREGTHLALRA